MPLSEKWPACDLRHENRRRRPLPPPLSRPSPRAPPPAPAGAPPAWVRRPLDLAEKHPAHRLTAADLRADGIDPVAAARYFRSHYGMTFQAYHRALRIGRALRTLRNGSAENGHARATDSSAPSRCSTVGRSAARAGFSERGFRRAFPEGFGAPPS